MLNRRLFFKHAFWGMIPLAKLGGLTAQSAEEASPKIVPQTIIDTHTHFYDPFRPQGVPWPGKQEKMLYRRVMPQDYKNLKLPHPVNGTVVVEASPWLEDNQWILDLAAEEPFIVGFVGNLDPADPGFPKAIKRFAQNPIFRGIRIQANGLSKGWNNAFYRDNLRLLAAYDLSLDINGGMDALPLIAQTAQELPGLRIIINHLTNLSIDGKEPPEPWQKGMALAAKQSNIACKVSGLVEGTGRRSGGAPNNLDYYRPVLNYIWQCFGADRLIYGSNWPVSELFAPCDQVQNIVQAFFQTKGQESLEKCFWQNALKFYKWNRR